MLFMSDWGLLAVLKFLLARTVPRRAADPATPPQPLTLTACHVTRVGIDSDVSFPSLH